MCEDYHIHRTSFFFGGGSGNETTHFLVLQHLDRIQGMKEGCVWVQKESLQLYNVSYTVLVLLKLIPRSLPYSILSR